MLSDIIGINQLLVKIVGSLWAENEDHEKTDRLVKKYLVMIKMKWMVVWACFKIIPLMRYKAVAHTSRRKKICQIRLLSLVATALVNQQLGTKEMLP